MSDHHLASDPYNPDYPITQTTPDGPRIVYHNAVAEPDPHRGGYVVRLNDGEAIRHFCSFGEASEFAEQTTRTANNNGAHHIGPPTTPNHSNDPNHI